MKKRTTTQINYRRIFLLGILNLCLVSAFAQQSLVFTESNADFRNALDLYEKEKFVPAQNYFNKTMNSIKDVHSEIRIDAEYYHAICAVELFHANAEALLRNFLERNPESNHVISAYFNLAKFQFRKRKWEDVIDYLASIHPLDLSPEERDEYYFKKGYSYFQIDEFDKAAQSFYEIKDTDNLYVSAARYYYAHISYQDKKYQTASENFKKIEQDKQFGPIVPYYLTQIYYLQGKYDQLLAYAPAVLDSAPAKKEEEIRKLIGDSYYKTGQFEKALPNLEKYLERNQGSPSDYYQLGVAYFKTKNYEQAIQSLQKSIGENDSLSQSAYYMIGEANVYSGNKSSAKLAFRNAYKLDVDSDITEDALFNYAKIAYELSYHPYDDAIVAFEEYINNYPKSSKINDAYEYLVGVYYTTKNYEKALESINRIKSQDIKLLKAKQRLAYYRGVELFQSKDFIDAIEMFQLSLKHNYDPSLKAAATYWMAESFFRVGDYDNADNYYSDFLGSTGAMELDYYKKGYYNVAYTHYERESYKTAIFWFKEYVENANFKNKGLINDAYLRIGDSYFIQKDYKNAVKYYGEAENTAVINEDYALFQSAVSYGIMGDYRKKISKLNTLLEDNPKSIYSDDALFELGKTEMILGKQKEALAAYNRLISEFPNSNYIAETQLKKGLIHYNQKEDDLALASFDEVVKKYPGSSNARAALDKIKKIYIEKGDANAFQQYVNGVSFADLSKNELDSTSYVIAENAYLSENCAKAIKDFSNYISKYPNGIYLLNANYYKGVCETKAGTKDAAIVNFEYVVAKPTNKFTEKSLLELGELYKKGEQREKAISSYLQVLKIASRKDYVRLAKNNLMQLYFLQKEYDNAATYAEEILEQELVDEKLWQQAQLTLGKTNMKKQNIPQAIVHLDTLSYAKNILGAEAKFLLAEVYNLQAEYGKSDTTIFRLVDQVPSFPYWIAKGFILLADNFYAKEDVYNARITYQSVIDNSDNAELVAKAKQKLNELEQNEAAKLNTEEGAIEINLDEDGDNQKLFETDSVSTKPGKIEEEVKDEK